MFENQRDMLSSLNISLTALPNLIKCSFISALTIYFNLIIEQVSHCPREKCATMLIYPKTYLKYSTFQNYIANA